MPASGAEFGHPWGGAAALSRRHRHCSGCCSGLGGRRAAVGHAAAVAGKCGRQHRPPNAVLGNTRSIAGISSGQQLMPPSSGTLDGCSSQGWLRLTLCQVLRQPPTYLRLPL